MLEDSSFKDLNCVRVLWLTIDKIENDQGDNPRINEYLTVYLDEFLTKGLIDKKKYDNFKRNIENQISVLDKTDKHM